MGEGGGGGGLNGAMRNSKVLLNEGTISFCNRNVAGEAFLQEKNGKKDAF